MKSHESEIPLQVVRHVLADAAAMCATDQRSVIRDVDTILARVKHEGLSFLTIVLPSFGSEFERALDLGTVSPTSFPGFRRRRGLPAFLSGFTGLVFDTETGAIRSDARFEAILAVRQICYTFKKVLLPCTTRRERKAIESYVRIEQELEQLQVPEDDLAVFTQVAYELWPQVFSDESDLGWETLVPKHGPGAVVEKISPNGKFSIRSWHERLQRLFPIDAYGFCNANHMDDEEEGLDEVAFLSPSEEPPVRVTLVPKTLKTPRVIAIEPVCHQYTQQALLRYLVNKIEGSPLTRGHVNFTNQRINRDLALESSHSTRLATLDLSAASDRVPYSLAHRMLSRTPILWAHLDACRSTRAQLPDGRIIQLSKFASMGSAVCFPVEAMYFLTVVLTALHKKANALVSPLSVRTLMKDVYIYGDDILVPTGAVASVSEALTTFGCKVNANKSFWTGKFRESCGLDAWDGEEVTPTYLRRLLSRRTDTQGLISWVETSNQFYWKGFWRTAAFLKEKVESLIGKLPIKKSEYPGLGFTCAQRGVSISGWSKRYQCLYQKTWGVETAKMQDTCTGWSALLKFFLRAEVSEPGKLDFLSPASIDKKHLECSERRGSVTLKRRKVLVS